MSTQLAINEDLIKYLQNVGYRKDPLVDELEKETKALGKVAQMQIAKEQGQFLEIIIKSLQLVINQQKNLPMGTFEYCLFNNFND